CLPWSYVSLLVCEYNRKKCATTVTAGTKNNGRINRPHGCFTLFYQLTDVAHCAAIGRSGHRGIGFERLRYITLTMYRMPGALTAIFHLGTTTRQFGFIHRQVDCAVWNIDLDHVIVMHQANGAPFCRFRRSMADDQA